MVQCVLVSLKGSHLELVVFGIYKLTVHSRTWLNTDSFYHSWLSVYHKEVLCRGMPGVSSPGSYSPFSKLLCSFARICSVVHLKDKTWGRGICEVGLSVICKRGVVCIRYILLCYVDFLLNGHMWFSKAKGGIQSGIFCQNPDKMLVEMDEAGGSFKGSFSRWIVPECCLLGDRTWRFSTSKALFTRE